MRDAWFRWDSFSALAQQHSRRAVGQCVRVEYCERVQILAAARCVCVSNCHDSLFNLGVGTRPLLLGDNRNLQLAPYNTYYDQLEAHMQVRPQAPRGWSRNHHHGARTDPH